MYGLKAVPFRETSFSAACKAPEVRFSNRLWLRPIGLEKRTPAAKAVKRQAFDNFSRALRQELLFHRLKPLTNPIGAAQLKRRLRRLGKRHAFPTLPSFGCGQHGLLTKI
jgi:hypothetical protein